MDPLHFALLLWKLQLIRQEHAVKAAVKAVTVAHTRCTAARTT